ncbi:glycosyltransferase [Rhizomonospora bruguierae]|uniref:glycosyltransferase n=1 Tax=Rhizomonospora bruguierae TaxID=1581705 RepID=UPI001BCF4D31|nr:glycosyltransferase [Micromonospora sp. NBRC 107566]
MRWLAFGTYDTGRHPRVAVLIQGLRDSGDEVTEVNARLPLDTAGRVAMLRQPWRLPVLAWQLGACWLRLIRAARRARAGEPDAVLVGYLGHFDVRLARRLFRRPPIALDHLVSAAGTGHDRGLSRAGGVKHALLRWIDRTALASADTIIVDTEEHLATLPPQARARAVVVPVGAAHEWFRPPPATRTGPLRVVFVGLFTPLHGTETIGTALAALAGDDIEITMVGRGQDHGRCRELAAPNTRVTWLDWVSGERLPALVAGHDVSLGIFGSTEKALRVVPTKVYQGLAAGCVVVTSDTEPQRAALGDAAVLVPPGDPAALAATLRDLAADPAKLARLKAAGHELAVSRFQAAAVVAPLRARVMAPAETVRNERETL